jgi:hypothetical protein
VTVPIRVEPAPSPRPSLVVLDDDPTGAHLVAGVRAIELGVNVNTELRKGTRP